MVEVLRGNPPTFFVETAFTETVFEDVVLNGESLAQSPLRRLNFSKNLSLTLSGVVVVLMYTCRLDGIPRTSEAATRRVEAFDSLVGSGTALFLSFV